MRLQKNGHPITCLDDWHRLAPPKRPEHWVEGRSAYELARAWCTDSGPAVPPSLLALLATSDFTHGLEYELGFPEHRITFDNHGGEPRNADLALVGRTPRSRVAVTIEAKADEPFGGTVAETMEAALERVIEKPASRGVRRIEDLVRALLTTRIGAQPSVGSLRYQLFTAAAGTLAYAIAEDVDIGVLVVHGFLTSKTKDHLHARNDDDYRLFLERLGHCPENPETLAGPFRVPGTPLFDKVPLLLIGKIATNCRGIDG